MFQAGGCALICKHKDKKSYISQSQNDCKTTANIWRTLLCITCQISFSITSKHRCAIYTNMPTIESDAKVHFSDNLYKNYIKIFLINRKEENNEDGF